MATHSSILAWRILWTEEPGGLQSIGMTEATKHSHTPTALIKREQTRDFPGGPVVENLPNNAGHIDLIPGPGRFHVQWGI